MRKKTTEATVDATQEATEEKKVTRKPRAPRKKAAPANEKAEKTTDGVNIKETKVEEPMTEKSKAEVPKAEEPKPQEIVEEKQQQEESTRTPNAADCPPAQEYVTEPVQEVKPFTPQPQKPVVAPVKLPVINNIIDLVNAPIRQIILSDQQIAQLSLEEVQERHEWFEKTLARVLDYDIVLSDTNIWIELLVGKSSSHSDPQVNARLQFERQLDFISKMTKHRKGRFMMMSETYEEIDRFATQQEPTNYRDADWTDESLCRNVAARLAKRLILSQQRENRLRIEGIGSESHHSAFADPAIIRRTVEFFAQGRSVLLITNDASVAIRSMGMCDDLQRHNNIDDDTWDSYYAPLRPMVVTMDDLKILDSYTRQYHFLQMAASKQWMEDVPQEREHIIIEPLQLWQDGFRPGDRYKESKQQNNQQKQKQQQPKQEQKQQQPKQEQKQQQQPKQEQKQQPKQEQKQNSQQPKQHKQNNQQKQDQKSESAAQQTTDVSAVIEQPAIVSDNSTTATEQPEHLQPEASVTEQQAAEQVTEASAEPKAKAKRRPSSRRSPRSHKTLADKQVSVQKEELS